MTSVGKYPFGMGISMIMVSRLILQPQYSWSNGFLGTKFFSGAWGKVQGRKKAFWLSFSMRAMMERCVEKYFCSADKVGKEKQDSKRLHSSKMVQ